VTWTPLFQLALIVLFFGNLVLIANDDDLAFTMFRKVIDVILLLKEENSEIKGNKILIFDDLERCDVKLETLLALLICSVICWVVVKPYKDTYMGRHFNLSASLSFFSCFTWL